MVYNFMDLLDRVIPLFVSLLCGEQVKCVVDIVAKMAMPFCLKYCPCDQASRKKSDFLFLPMAALSPVASEPGTLQWPLSQSSTWRGLFVD